MSAHRTDSDQFLSEEDLDLANLSWAELLLWWDEALQQAQASNDLDEHEYSHGVFALPRAMWPRGVEDRLPAPRTGAPPSDSTR